MKSFESFVDGDIRFRQHGEGLCYSALLNIYLKMIGRYGWTTEKIAKVLGVTTSNGIEHSLSCVFYTTKRLKFLPEG